MVFNGCLSCFTLVHASCSCLLLLLSALTKLILFTRWSRIGTGNKQAYNVTSDVPQLSCHAGMIVGGHTRVCPVQVKILSGLVFHWLGKKLTLDGHIHCSYIVYELHTFNEWPDQSYVTEDLLQLIIPSGGRRVGSLKVWTVWQQTLVAVNPMTAISSQGTFIVKAEEGNLQTGKIFLVNTISIGTSVVYIW